jgi:hypothetical protein
VGVGRPDAVGVGRALGAGVGRVAPPGTFEPPPPQALNSTAQIALATKPRARLLPPVSQQEQIIARLVRARR